MASKGAHLFILVLLLLFGSDSNPRGETILKDVKVCEKETATLLCVSDAPQPTYHWRFASSKKVPVKTDKYEQLQNGAKLLVKNVDHSDAAKIKFISCHTHSKDMRKIVYLYKIVVNCENYQTPVGSSVRLPCKINIPDDEIDYIKWTFFLKRHSKTERIKLFKRDGRTTLASSLIFNGRVSTQNKTLIIQTIKMDDKGIYHCIAYRAKNFNLSNARYHYNVSVTARTTTKPLAVDTTPSTKAITLGPNVGYTVEPAPNTSSQPQFPTPTTPIRKTVLNLSTGSVQESTTSTPSKSQSTQGSTVPTNKRFTVSTAQTTKPTTASLSNKELNKRFSTKLGVLPTTSFTVTFNETHKEDDRTPNGSNRTAPSIWTFVFLLFHFVNIQANNAFT